MSDEEPTWPLEEHIRQGEELIRRLPRVEPHHARICFHFTPAIWHEDEPWGEDASFNRRAKPFFTALALPLNVDYVGGTSGIEAWEDVVPTVDWLHARIPVLIDLASKTDLVFAGWSFEPTERRDISFLSCGPSLDVVNRYSPEGQTAINELVASTQRCGTTED